MKIEKIIEPALCGTCFLEKSENSTIYPTWRITMGGYPFERKMTLCRKHLKLLQSKIEKELEDDEY